MRNTNPDYNLIGNVQINPFDLAGTVRGIESTKQAIMNNKITMGQLNDKDTAEKIMKASIDPSTGVVDYDKAISNLSSAGLTDYAAKAIDFKNKVEDQKAEVARRAGYNNYQSDIVNGNQEITGTTNEGTEVDPSALPTDKNLSGVTTSRTGDLTYGQKVDSYLKNVPLDTETAMDNALKLAKEKEPSEQDKKDKKLDFAYNHVFGMPEVQPIYQTAMKIWSSGKASSQEKQAAQDKLLSVIESADDVDGSTKGLLADRIKKTFSVPQPTMEEAIAKADALRKNAIPDEIKVADAKAKNAALRTFNESVGDSESNIATIEKHVDDGDYSWLATVARPNGFVGGLLDLAKTMKLTPGQNELAQASGQLYNAYKKANAGTAVSATEKAAIDDVFGKGIVHSKEQFMSAVGLMKKAIEAKRQAIIDSPTDSGTGTAPGAKPRSKKSAHDWTKDL